MIKSFRHKGLKELFETGGTRSINKAFYDRAKRRLDALHAATRPEHVNLPGFDFHALRGKPKRYSLHVNGPWCITFEFADGDVYKVDFEQYH